MQFGLMEIYPALVNSPGSGSGSLRLALRWSSGEKPQKFPEMDLFLNGSDKHSLSFFIFDQ